MLPSKGEAEVEPDKRIQWAQNSHEDWVLHEHKFACMQS